MKLSRSTIQLLKLCQRINENKSIPFSPGGIVVKTSGVLRTIACHKAILMEASVPEQIPAGTAIYDLKTFLANVTEDTEIEFGDSAHIRLRNGRSVTKILRGNPDLIFHPPDKNILADYQERVFLHADDLSEVLRKGNKSPNVILGCGDIGKAVEIELADAKGDPCFSQLIECKFPRLGTQAFSAVFKIVNLKILKGSYEVEIASKGVAKWTWLHGDVTFWIAMEAATSWFGEKPKPEGRYVEPSAGSAEDQEAA